MDNLGESKANRGFFVGGGDCFVFKGSKKKKKKGHLTIESLTVSSHLKKLLINEELL